MKHTLRALLLLLVVAMICPVIASCAGGDDGPETQAADTTTVAGDVTAEVTTDNGLDQNGYIKDDLDQYELNFNRDQINILNWIAEKPEFYVETTDGTKVNDAIFNRNATIEGRLNVELNFTEQAGNNDNRTAFIQRVEAAQGSTGADSFDLVLSYSRVAGTLSIRGLYADLNDIDNNYINYEKPWWPETLVDTVTIGDSLYFVSGDASTNVLHFMYTIYFNKDLVKIYDIQESFYDLVNDGNWTINRLITLSSNRYEDNPSAGVVGKGANFSSSDLEDTYGFCTIYYGVDAFYTGAGLKLITQDEDELLKVSEDYGSQKTIDLIAKLGPWLSGPDCVTFMGSGQYRQPFVNGRALFCQERAYLAQNYLTDVEFKYGILPTPKYDAKQEDYRTIVGNPFTLYGISSWTAPERQTELTAVLECWGSEGYRLTTPALFEETMKARYAEAQEDADMWNIIRRTACFDLGRLFGKDELGYYVAEEPSKIACQNGNWQRSYNTIMSLLKPKLETVVGKYRDIQG